jgi:hypothetical protein
MFWHFGCLSYVSDVSKIMPAIPLGRTHTTLACHVRVILALRRLDFIGCNSVSAHHGDQRRSRQPESRGGTISPADNPACLTKSRGEVSALGVLQSPDRRGYKVLGPEIRNIRAQHATAAAEAPRELRSSRIETSWAPTPTLRWSPPSRLRLKTNGTKSAYCGDVGMPVFF